MNWRNLTLLLILANFLYFAWNSWIAQPEIVGLEDQSLDDVPVLRLVSEAGTPSASTITSAVINPSTQSAVPAIMQPSTELAVDTGLNTEGGGLVDPDLPVTVDIDTGEVTEPDVSSLVCRRIGAFVNEQDANEAMAWFETEGISTVKKISMASVWQGYWVYLPAYPNREAAVQVVEALREKGIKDMFIEITSPHRNALSLGLYRQRSGAEIRSRQIQAQGFASRIGNKEREQAVFWLETEVDAEREIPIDRLSAPIGQVRRVEIKPCQ